MLTIARITVSVLLLTAPQVLYAQATLQETFDALKESLNKRKPELLERYLSPGFRIGELTDEMARDAMRQFIRSYDERIVHISIGERQLQSDGYTVTATFQFTDKSSNFTFLTDTRNRFLEIRMFTVTSRNQPLYPSANNVVLPDSMTVPFRLGGRLILVNAELNGKRRTFVLDNGAPFMVLNRRLLGRTTTSSDSVERISGISGEILDRGMVDINRFVWGTYISKNYKAVAADLSNAERSTDETIAGLIGFSTIRDYQITLDYRNNRIVLVKVDREGIPVVNVDEGTPIYEGPFSMKQHLPVVDITIGNKLLKVGIDCGAEANVLRDVLSKSTYTVLGDELMDGADNITKIVKRVRIPDARLGGKLKIATMEALLADLGHLNYVYDLQLDGLLGYEFLSEYKTTLNFRTRTMRLYN